jgi:hypothetical protein
MSSICPSRFVHFEALSRLDAEDQQTVLNVIDGLMLKHQAQQWGPRRQVHVAEPEAATTSPAPAPRNKRASAPKRRASR